MSVYFITQENRQSGYYKIGWAKNPEKRLLDLQTGNPFKLEIVLTMEGGRKKEAALHKKYSLRRRHGEWFNLLGEDLLVLAHDSDQGLAGLSWSDLERVPWFRQWFGLLEQRDNLDFRWNWLPDDQWVVAYMAKYNLPAESLQLPYDLR